MLIHVYYTVSGNYQCFVTTVDIEDVDIDESWDIEVLLAL